jgi:YHS domain-containing protein
VARLVLFAVLGFLIVRAMWRLLYGIVEGASSAGAVNGRRPGRLRRSEKMERDPVCGTFVLPSRALTSGSGETIQYFCSEECRRRFVAR